jgi:hypothetical protein
MCHFGSGQGSGVATGAGGHPTFWNLETDANSSEAQNCSLNAVKFISGWGSLKHFP